MPPSTEPTSAAPSPPSRPGPNRAHRAAWLALAVPLLFFAGLMLVSYLQARHAALDHALMQALQQKDAALVKSLLAQGADPNTTEPLKAPLPMGVFAHFLQTLRSLFRHNAAVGGDWQTALVLAVKTGSTENVRALLAHGAKAYRQDSTGTTPIWYAADAGNLAVARLLLEHATDIEAHCGEGWTALTAAMWENVGKEGRRAVLLQRLQPGQRQSVAQFEAIEREFQKTALQMTRLLLDCGADVNARDNSIDPLNAELGVNRWTPLMRAAAAGLPFARLLLDRGADATLKNEEGETPLLETQDPDVARLLLDRSLGKTPSKGDLQSALVSAAIDDSIGSIGTMRLLLDRGADVNGRDGESGKTALTVAACNEHDDEAICLLQRGARVDERNSKSTAAQMHSANGHNSTDALLLRCGMESATALMYAAHMGLDSSVALLLRSGAQVDARDAAGTHRPGDGYRERACEHRNAAAEGGRTHRRYPRRPAAWRRGNR